MTCCNVPSNNRQARGKNNLAKVGENLIENVDQKSKLTDGQDKVREKDLLLTNQIQAHNDNYGTKAESNNQKQLQALANDRGFQESLTTSTSALIPKSRSAEEDEYTKYTELNFDDKSVTPPSSIDIDQYKENPMANMQKENEQSVKSTEFQEMGQSFTGQQTASGEVAAGNSETANSAESKMISSFTKIGDYARLEYSPVEDLDSVTTKSHSRPGSMGRTDFADKPASEQEASEKRRPATSNVTSNATSQSVSRRSSRGIESTSISIASQLSNEQLQQNLTNMIESANSPTALFGTIGLPLGPPLDNDMAGPNSAFEGDTETRKTSPETTGAALTSASQDSLSGNDYDNSRFKTATLDSNEASEAALIGDSYENSNEIAPLANVDETILSRKQQSSVSSQQTRNESALSMTTTTSDALTNPTPTPSEMSSGIGVEGKKKSKLRPKNLLKRFKSGKKKNKTETTDQ